MNVELSERDRLLIKVALNHSKAEGFAAIQLGISAVESLKLNEVTEEIAVEEVEASVPYPYEVTTGVLSFVQKLFLDAVTAGMYTHAVGKYLLGCRDRLDSKGITEDNGTEAVL